MMRRLNTGSEQFSLELSALIDHAGLIAPEVQKTVSEIIHAVRKTGDQALLHYAAKFDDFKPQSIESLRVSPSQMAAACELISRPVDEALRLAAERVGDYHQRQLEALGQSWDFEDALGNVLGQRVQPMARVGVYAPGGKACYPSTVLMTAIPAKVAGVASVALAVPAKGGVMSPVLLAAAHYAGVDEIWIMGGAQAIAALAYGTESIRSVDKICGPGNVFVTAAKKQVYGDVGIDMLAGPSEVLVVADDSARVDWVIADLLAQAEHDEQAQSIVVSQSAAFLDAVQAGLADMVAAQPRRAIIENSLRHRGLLIHAETTEDLISVINRVAPEHLELAISNPESLLPDIRSAGAIFVGQYSPEVLGDYTAGPSHVLPTSGTARFASALGVYDFQLKQSLIHCSAGGGREIAKPAAVLAKEEGLYAHALSAIKRFETGE
jgi:histidinol dehydrogenase